MSAEMKMAKTSEKMKVNTRPLDAALLGSFIFANSTLQVAVKIVSVWGVMWHFLTSQRVDFQIWIF